MRRVKIKLRLFLRKIESQKRKMEAQAIAAKKQAIIARQRGDDANVRTYIKSYLQFKGWADGLSKFSLQLQALQFKLETASNMTDLNETLGKVGEALGNLSSLRLPNMEDVLSSIDMNLSEFNYMFEATGEAMDMMGSTDDVQITDKQIDDVLSEIDSELLVDAAGALPSTTPSKISSLQDEIERLKDKR
ncbi:MAG: Snf7 family protein [Promethearchaeota archaeon]